MHTLIDVRDLAPGLREESWRTMLHDLFGLDVEVGHDLPTGFHNRLKGHEFGALMLTEIEGHAQYTKVVPEPAAARRDGILAWVALQGSGTLVQDDQRVQVAPGLLTICSGNRPRTAVRTSAFHHIVLNVPRRVLVPHLRGHELRIPCSLDAVSGPGALLCDFVTALVTHGGDVAPEPRLALEDVLLRLLATALLHAPEARPSAGGTESVQRARIREYVVQHLRDPELSVDSISRARRAVAALRRISCSHPSRSQSCGGSGPCASTARVRTCAPARPAASARSRRNGGSSTRPTSAARSRSASARPPCMLAKAPARLPNPALPDPRCRRHTHCAGIARCR